MSARLDGYTTTTAVLGGNRTMKVKEWHAYSLPSEVYFEFRSRTNVTQAQAQGIADGVGATIEAVLAFADVTDVAWSQEVTDSGQLQGVFTVYWRVPDPDRTGWVEVPYVKFTTDAVALAIVGDAGFGNAPL